MKIVLFITVALVFLSCKKEEDRSCFKSTGSETSEVREVESFNRIFLGGHVIYELVPDTVNKIILSGGENLLNGITTNVVDGKLSIENTNECAFLRSYDDAVSLELHFVDVYNIEYEGTFPTTCRDTINAQNLAISIRDGAGPLDLKLNCFSLTMNVLHGWGSFILSGKSNYATITVGSNGSGDAYDFVVNNELNVVSTTVSDTKVNASGCVFRAETNQSGNIRYKGVPSSIEYNQYGSGELIDEN